MEKINISIDNNDYSFLIDIQVDGREIISTENNEKDKEFIDKLQKLLNAYGY